MPKTKRQVPPLEAADRGKCFTRSELGLPSEYRRNSHVKYGKEEYLFVTINNGKYMNELHADGVVHEPANKKDLAGYDFKKSKDHEGRHIMVRFLNKGNLEYEYIGDEQYMIQYDKIRNKIFIVEAK